MLSTHLDKVTTSRIEELIEANFGGRDKLYEAANSMNDENCKQICKQLAERLASHATELQQILYASGHEANDPLEIDYIVKIFFESIKKKCGETGVIQAAEDFQKDLKRGYDRAIEDTAESQAKGTLREQRAEVDFGEKVLHKIKSADTSAENDC
ncbi:MAG: PA2169 family four-helix-bundle protein [Pirellulales bacterium]|nr:PA2169 family four-helix-bundle protein [Pirellulales bacterium]